MNKLKRRAKQRRKQLNNALITFGNKKLVGRDLQSVDEKHRVVFKLYYFQKIAVRFFRELKPTHRI